MDDSLMYTGVDGNTDGIFGNEKVEETTKAIMDEQRQQIAELTPKLQSLIDMVDNEIKLVMSIDRFAQATTTSEVDVRAELQASALYKQYLDNLKTKFTIALNEVKGK